MTQGNIWIKNGEQINEPHGLYNENLVIKVVKFDL
jgi:hypothetical protein